eukprot:2400746-Amphidinium_carterae.1
MPQQWHRNRMVVQNLHKARAQNGDVLPQKELEATSFARYRSKMGNEPGFRGGQSPLDQSATQQTSIECWGLLYQDEGLCVMVMDSNMQAGMRFRPGLSMQFRDPLLEQGAALALHQG